MPTNTNTNTGAAPGACTAVGVACVGQRWGPGAHFGGKTTWEDSIAVAAENRDGLFSPRPFWSCWYAPQWMLLSRSDEITAECHAEPALDRAEAYMQHSREADAKGDERD